MKVLLIDDDADVRDLLRRALQGAEDTVIDAADVVSARRACAQEPDLVVLDLGLPGGSGLSFCRQLRAEGSQIPVLGLTTKSRVALRVQALDAGADDCMSQPFALVELRARVRALARRTSRQTTFRAPLARATFREVELDFTRRLALRSGAEVQVTPGEWAILDLLAARDGAVVRRDELLELARSDSRAAASNSVEVLIGRLRRKLGKGIIRTVRAEGYAFTSPTETVKDPRESGQ